MRKRSEHSNDDADCESNSGNSAGVDDHSDNGEDSSGSTCNSSTAGQRLKLSETINQQTCTTLQRSEQKTCTTVQVRTQ